MYSDISDHEENKSNLICRRCYGPVFGTESIRMEMCPECELLASRTRKSIYRWNSRVSFILSSQNHSYDRAYTDFIERMEALNKKFKQDKENQTQYKEQLKIISKEILENKLCALNQNRQKITSYLSLIRNEIIDRLHRVIYNKTNTSGKIFLKLLEGCHVEISKAVQMCQKDTEKKSINLINNTYKAQFKVEEELTVEPYIDNFTSKFQGKMIRYNLFSSKFRILDVLFNPERSSPKWLDYSNFIEFKAGYYIVCGGASFLMTWGDCWIVPADSFADRIQNCKSTKNHSLEFYNEAIYLFGGDVPICQKIIINYQSEWEDLEKMPEILEVTCSSKIDNQAILCGYASKKLYSFNFDNRVFAELAELWNTKTFKIVFEYSGEIFILTKDSLIAGNPTKNNWQIISLITSPHDIQMNSRMCGKGKIVSSAFYFIVDDLNLWKLDLMNYSLTKLKLSKI
ncbi:hypothetical protein SteCoe_20523 [Stentor coeruleus]|uniref:Uncharacterized protein n=1 Tax=Stentor coeruleus TaxID=5963 RepID=A0A1R2BRU1_9CILI|nr:hypothetical protein SteCoe_20523 [Stentor coeruleus]